jgi:hypothetical protein
MNLINSALIQKIQSLHSQVSKLDPYKQEDVTKLKALKEKELPVLLKEANKIAPFATEMLKHYFGNTGKTKIINLKNSPIWGSEGVNKGKNRIESYLGFNGNSPDSVEGENWKTFSTTKGKIKQAFQKDPTKKTMQITDTWDAKVESSGQTDDADNLTKTPPTLLNRIRNRVPSTKNIESHFGLGTFVLKALFKGEATRTRGDSVSVKGTVDYTIKDRYDWIESSWVTLPFGMGKIEDNTMAKFEKAKLAKSFEVGSTVISEKVDYRFSLDK